MTSDPAADDEADPLDDDEWSEALRQADALCGASPQGWTPLILSGQQETEAVAAGWASIWQAASEALPPWRRARTGNRRR